MAQALGTLEGTAISHTCSTAAKIEVPTLRLRVPVLVGQRLWRVLASLKRNGDARLGGRLLDLAQVQAFASAMMPGNQHAMSKLWLARLAVTME